MGDPRTHLRFCASVKDPRSARASMYQASEQLSRSPFGVVTASGAFALFAYLDRRRLHRCSTSLCPVTNTRMPPGASRS